MKSALKPQSQSIPKQQTALVPHMAKASFKKIAPFWPLKNLIAVNPLQGLEDLPIEEALATGAAYSSKLHCRKKCKP